MQVPLAPQLLKQVNRSSLGDGLPRTGVGVARGVILGVEIGLILAIQSAYDLYTVSAWEVLVYMQDVGDVRIHPQDVATEVGVGVLVGIAVGNLVGVGAGGDPQTYAENDPLPVGWYRPPGHWEQRFGSPLA